MNDTSRGGEKSRFPDIFDTARRNRYQARRDNGGARKIQTGDLWLERVAPGPEREAHLPLLLLADEPQPVRGYLQLGDLYVLRAGTGHPLGVTHVLPCESEQRSAELKAVAIDQTRHNQGLGRQMLAMVLDDLRACGTRRVIVGTSNAGIGEIAFYQKDGGSVSGVSNVTTSRRKKATTRMTATTACRTGTWCGSIRNSHSRRPRRRTHMSDDGHLFA